MPRLLWAAFSRFRRSLAGEIVEVLLIAAALFLIGRAGIQNFKVDGHSMNHTLRNNELVLVDKLTYDFATPQRGDIVVFKYPGDTRRDYIKRIIGIPGDRVDIHGGHVFVNGAALHENYIEAPPAYTMSKIPGTNSDRVPRAQYFVLGDNRNNSDDSHLWGLVPRKDIIGRALVAYWPFSKLGLLGRL